MQKPKKASELQPEARQFLGLCKIAVDKGKDCEFPEHGLRAITTRRGHHQPLFGKDEHKIGLVQLKRSDTDVLVFEARFKEDGEPRRVRHGEAGEWIEIQAE